MYAFEPDVNNFQELYVKSQSYSRLTVLPFAVDIGDNQEPLFEQPDGQSTLQPPWGQPGAAFRMVWTIRLDTFMRLYSIEKIDYLRIDAPFRDEMCLESLGSMVDRVQRGRVCVYTMRGFEGYAQSLVPEFLRNNGFECEYNSSTESGRTEIRFWRP